MAPRMIKGYLRRRPDCALKGVFKLREGWVGSRREPPLLVGPFRAANGLPSALRRGSVSDKDAEAPGMTLLAGITW